MVRVQWHTNLHLTGKSHDASFYCLQVFLSEKVKPILSLIRVPAILVSTYKTTQGPRNNYSNSVRETNIAIILCAIAVPEEYFLRKLAHYSVYCIVSLNFGGQVHSKQLCNGGVFLAKLVILYI